MKIILENTDDLNKCGIYKIYCKENNKFYIGSTGKSFKQRFSQHKSKLKNNKHSCKHLQAAYNLYGEDSFEFSIVKIMDSNIEDILLEESKTIKDLDACNSEIGFNLNPNCNKSAMLCKDVSMKVSEALKEKYKEGIPHMKKYEFQKEQEPWNKGIKIEDTSNYHSKKTITEAVLKSREVSAQKARNRSDLIEVYTEDNIKLKEFNSISDLVDWSKTEENDLPLDFTRSKTKSLNSSKLSVALKTGNKYRGLYFKRAPKDEKLSLENGVNSGNAAMPILSQASSTLDEGAETTCAV